MLLSIHLNRKATKDKPQKKAYKEGLRYFSEQENRLFRSTWEVELAELLTSLGITYEYEPQRVYFKEYKESYLCDFYLPEYNVWVEVKGYYDKRSQKRCNLWRKYHGHTAGFFLYMKEERDLILNNPNMLYTYLDISIQEWRRIANEKQLQSGR